MASKKALTDEELFAQFEDIPSAGDSAPSKRVIKPAKASADTPTLEEDDPLAELSALASARPPSRSSTPRLSSSTTSGTGRQKTPASSGPPSTRTSEDRPRAAAPTVRQSTESTRDYHLPQNVEASQASLGSSYETVRPAASPKPDIPAPAAGGGGGWWGSVFTAASAAVKQAEAAVKEIRENEEAQKWAQQVRGNVDVLKAYGETCKRLSTGQC